MYSLWVTNKRYRQKRSTSQVTKPPRPYTGLRLFLKFQVSIIFATFDINVFLSNEHGARLPFCYWTSPCHSLFVRKNFNIFKFYGNILNHRLNVRSWKRFAMMMLTKRFKLTLYFYQKGSIFKIVQLVMEFTCSFKHQKQGSILVPVKIISLLHSNPRQTSPRSNGPGIKFPLMRNKPGQSLRHRKSTPLYKFH